MKGCQEEKTFKKGTTMYTQGLGQPRMTVEDRIFDMMAKLDEHSEKIPEGMYLQFCDHLKVFHQNYENEKKGVAAEEVAGQLWVFANAEDFREENERLEAMFARPRGPRRCGCCRQVGHDRRTCPQWVRELADATVRVRGLV